MTPPLEVIGEGPSRPFDIASILDHGPWHSRQKLILLLVSLVAMVDGIDAQVLSLAIPTIGKEWGVARPAFGIVLGLSFIAMAVGTVLGGFAGDRLGRKTALIGATGAFGAFTLVGAFSHDLPMLGLSRALASLGLGAAMPNVATIIAEYTPVRRRSIALGIAMSGLPIGGVVLGLLAAVILPHEGWRTLFLVAGGLPLLVSALLLAFLPESLRFLVRNPANVARIGRIVSSMSSSGHTRTFTDSGETLSERRAPISAVLSGSFAVDTCLIAVAFFFVVFATYLVFAWAPSLLTDRGFSSAFIGTGLSCFSAGGLIGGLAGAKLVERTGSRPALIGMGLFGAVAAATLAALLPTGGGGPVVSLLLCLFCAGLAIPGTGAVIYVLAGQIYPSSIRATGVGVSAGFGRLGAVTSAFVGPLLLRGSADLFFPATAGAMLAVAAALAFVRRQVPRQAS